MIYNISIVIILFLISFKGIALKKFSQEKMVETITALRKEKGLTQAQLAEATGINRAMIGRIENSDYIPTIEQMEALADWTSRKR